MLKNWRGWLVALCVALAVSLLLSVSLKTSSADVRIPDHPASQGRTLAPAGAPVLDAVTLHWMRRTSEQNLAFADMADPRVLNEIIWFSVRGAHSPMPEISRLPAFDAMLPEIEDDEADERAEMRPAHATRAEK